MPSGLGSVAPRGDDWWIRRIAALEKKVDQLMTQRTLESASVGAGGIRSANFDGSLDPATAGTAGWGLSGSTGDAIVNSLIVRNGIIGDDALQNPIKTDYYYAQQFGFAVAPGPADGTDPVQASVNVTIPAGFTSATVFAAVQDSAWNGSGFADYLYSCINFGAPGADYVYQISDSIYSPGQGNSIVVTTDQFTGLSGGDVVSIQSRPCTAGHTWAALGVNATQLSVLALFLR